jgi:alpha-L-rhamnosidase
MRTLITQDPFIHLNANRNWREQGWWPAHWIACGDAGSPPFVTAFRRQFSIDQNSTIRVHVAADERYDLYLDGNWIGRGNERGAPDLWFYETYDLPLHPGEHTLVARVWSLGEQAPEAQMSVQPGFLLAAEEEWGDVLNTGTASWTAKRLDGYSFLSPWPAHWRGARVQIDGISFPWGYQNGDGEGWSPVHNLQPALGRLSDWQFHRQYLLRPATLPPLLNREFSGSLVRFAGAVSSMETRPIPIRADDADAEAVDQWQRMLDGLSSVVVAPNTVWRVLIDLDDYYCAFPEITLSGGKGSRVRMYWSESLYQQPDTITGWKGNRGAVEGKYFIGYGDEFIADGADSRCFDVLWWQAGRYIELCCQTEDEPLRIEGIAFRENRYPLEMESQFTASEKRLEQVIPILVRGMQMCANETYFDCPYYEELQYAGDTRLECLTTYVMSRDDRLPKKAMRLFDSSRLASGLTQSRYPSRIMQIIPPFALWWVMMVRDYAYWRDDLEFVRGLLPGVRATIEGFQRFIGQDGLLYGPEGWNTLDWVPAWDNDSGVPPDGHSGASGLMNWQLIYAIVQAADLEEIAGEPLLAEHFRQRASRLAERAAQVFWNDNRGLLADDLQHQHFSEHTQCMALLSGLLPAEKAARAEAGLLNDSNLERATIYFSYYLFETFRMLGRVDALLARMPLWFDLIEQDFRTTMEKPEPSRSDCHAWGAHPLFHYFATILGIRPASLGFRKVIITPQLANLEHAAGRLVHPSGGEILMDVRQENGALHGTIRIPEGISGTLVLGSQEIGLSVGENIF